MKWLSYKQVRIASLNVDAADIRKRTKAAHVAELAQNIRESGDQPIHAPTVRASDKRLLCGRDRVAALMMLKAKKAWIHLVDCDDAEAAQLEAWENVYRRPVENRAQILAALVASKEQQIAAATGDTVPGSTGRVKAEARRQVARAAGITTGAVKKAEQRAKAAAALPSPAEVMGEFEGVPQSAVLALDLLGCDDNSARAVAKYARKDQEAIDEADKYLQLAQRAISGMAAGAVQQQLHADVHRVASRVRSHRPEFLCPWCKGLPKATLPGCVPCAGMGYVPAEVCERAPKELREGPAMVAIDGVFYPYEDVRAGKLPATNGTAKKPGKRVTAQDEHGNEIPLDADEAY